MRMRRNGNKNSAHKSRCISVSIVHQIIKTNLNLLGVRAIPCYLLYTEHCMRSIIDVVNLLQVNLIALKAQFRRILAII